MSGRLGNIDLGGAEIILTEFDYTGENEIIYDENKKIQ